MEYKWIICMQMNEMYVHSHLVLNTVLWKWNEMEITNEGTGTWTTNSTKITKH